MEPFTRVPIGPYCVPYFGPYLAAMGPYRALLWALFWALPIGPYIGPYFAPYLKPFKALLDCLNPFEPYRCPIFQWCNRSAWGCSIPCLRI